MKLNPYLIFLGNAEEVLNFYHKVLGGEITMMSRYADAPMPCDEDWKNKIMHSRLEFDGNMIMISDTMKGMTDGTVGGNIHMSVDVESVEKIDKVFAAMSEGGTVTMPLDNTFWGARFGMLKDKFGVAWMFNCELKK